MYNPLLFTEQELREFRNITTEDYERVDIDTAFILPYPIKEEDSCCYDESHIVEANSPEFDSAQNVRKFSLHLHKIVIILNLLYLLN